MDSNYKIAMVRETVYLVDKSHFGFRLGFPAEITGIEMCTPGDSEPRFCYHIRYSDGTEDWKPLEDGDYDIVTFTELLAKKYRI